MDDVSAVLISRKFVEGADRILNLPFTVEGIIVMGPGPLQAPSIPCSDRLGNLMRPMRSATLSLESATGPVTFSKSSTVKSRASYCSLQIPDQMLSENLRYAYSSVI
jgi:hypothetical protein